MDDGTFDRVILRLGRLISRRAAVGGLGALTWPGLAAAKKKRRKKKRKKCKGKQKCGGQCIPKSACCTDADCDGEESCCFGKCTTPVFCGEEKTCGCDEVCKVGGGEVTCQAGGCPAGVDVCNDQSVLYFCGASEYCWCTTSVEGQVACVDSTVVVCVECTTDAQCADELDQPAICIDLGTICSCGMVSTTACVPIGCPSDVAGRAKARSSPVWIDSPALRR